MINYKVQVKEMIIKNDMYYKDNLLLTYTIKYPQFFSTKFLFPLLRMNQYYKNKALAFKKYCEKTLYKMAVEQYEQSIANGFPVRTFEALLVYEITYNQNCTISLFFDQYEYTGGAHGNTLRYSDTWNLQKGIRIKLSQLFPNNSNYKAHIIKTINNQIAQQIKNGQNYYFEDYKELVVKYFNEESFYLTKEGVNIYYQQYDIAPYSSGIPVFVIPFSIGNAAQPKCL